MSKLVRYADGYHTSSNVEDLLKVEGFDRLKLSSPDYAKIFGTDEQMGLFFAKNLIIDLFKFIGKDLFINFNQFNFPVNNHKYYYWNTFVKMFEDKALIDTYGKYGKCVIETSMFSCGEITVKPNVRWMGIVKNNLRKGLNYFHEKRTGKSAPSDKRYNR